MKRALRRMKTGFALVKRASWRIDSISVPKPSLGTLFCAEKRAFTETISFFEWVKRTMESFRGSRGTFCALRRMKTVLRT